LKKVTKFLRKCFIFPILLYQKYISPNIAPRCKYYPTCSNYAVTAIEKHGIIFGTLLAVWRILRCNPWSKGGFDYVPETLFCKKQKKTKGEQ